MEDYLKKKVKCQFCENLISKRNLSRHYKNNKTCLAIQAALNQNI